MKSKLPAVPAAAQAEVDRNLKRLDKQIAKANKKLAASVGKGGRNVVQKAILNPLKNQRVATIKRIADAIGRKAAKPQGLEALAPCTVNAGGAANNGGAATPSATGCGEPVPVGRLVPDPGDVAAQCRSCRVATPALLHREAAPAEVTFA